MFTRRQILSASCSASSLMLLAACTPAGTPSVTVPTTVDPQILSDLQMVVAESGTIVTLVQKYKPKTLTPAIVSNITTAQSAAQALLTAVSTNTPAPEGASTMETIFSYVNTILSDAGPVLEVVATVDPALQPAVIAYDLIIPLLPIIESYLGSFINNIGATSTGANYKPIEVHYTVDQARQVMAMRSAQKS